MCSTEWPSIVDQGLAPSVPRASHLVRHQGLFVAGYGRSGQEADFPLALSDVPSHRCWRSDHIRALTARHPIKLTSIRCQSAWQPNPGRRPTYRCGKSVQTTGATSALRLRLPSQETKKQDYKNQPPTGPAPFLLSSLMKE